MRRAAAFLGSAFFFLLAPGTAAGLVPWTLTGWRFRPPLLGLAATRIAGGLLILAALLGLIDCFARFALEGNGTPAPAAPPDRLVVSGPYRHVRNPIYGAVVTLILGQALLLGAPALLVYGILFWLGAHLFVVRAEEPRLGRRFGPGYAAYRAAVPRWIPRLSPWRGPSPPRTPGAPHRADPPGTGSSRGSP